MWKRNKGGRSLSIFLFLFTYFLLSLYLCVYVCVCVFFLAASPHTWYLSFEFWLKRAPLQKLLGFEVQYDINVKLGWVHTLC
ncbi:hypothetical protein LX36DRAFT_649946 [Colletotrichum falcatum]|nr:hypothetical protein LX36DRAFT_649946 [Colletotrichum falcatum]